MAKGAASSRDNRLSYLPRYWFLLLQDAASRYRDHQARDQRFPRWSAARQWRVRAKAIQSFRHSALVGATIRSRLHGLRRAVLSLLHPPVVSWNSFSTVNVTSNAYRGSDTDHVSPPSRSMPISRKDCRVHIVNIERGFRRTQPEHRRSILSIWPPTNPRARHPHTEHIRMMVATLRAFRKWRATKLAVPDDQCGIQ